MKTWIYTLWLDGKCVYVGQSTHPEMRRLSHMKPAGKFHGEEPQYKLVRQVEIVRSHIIEKQVLLAYRRKGSPLRNDVMPSSIGHLIGDTRCFRLIRTGEIIYGARMLGFRLGVTGAAINFRLRNGTEKTSEVCESFELLSE